MEIRVVVNGFRFAGAGKMWGFLEQQEPPSSILCICVYFYSFLFDYYLTSSSCVFSDF